MNRNKLAMVDLDGTLIFTGRANYAAYRQALAEAGFAVCVPAEEYIAELNRIIFEELCVGEIREESRQYFVDFDF